MMLVAPRGGEDEEAVDTDPLIRETTKEHGQYMVVTFRV
jgi:hypothetical protein